MIASRDLLEQGWAAQKAHKLRAVLTMLGLTLGVATIIGVMTLIQGTNKYVEQKIANLGTDVFRVAREPFLVTNFEDFIKARRTPRITLEDYEAIAGLCRDCARVGAQSGSSSRVRRGDKTVSDIGVNGQSPTMGEIDTRAIVSGRYLTENEDSRAVPVAVVGQGIVEKLFDGSDPVGKEIRVGNDEFTIIGTYEKLGSVLGQDQDNFVVIPLRTFLKTRGSRTSLEISVRAREGRFEPAMDEVRALLRARRHVPPNGEDGFFMATQDTYMSLWKSISSAFFAVFLMVSSISAVVGGIVIMNVMLVSVTERTKEIGIRRALGATERDIMRQFLTESVMQCIAGGICGVALGLLAAIAIRTFTGFPADVQAWVALLGVVLSCGIGLFFGIYPATRAAKLDPVVALRADK